MTGELFFWYVLPVIVAAVVWAAILVHERSDQGK